MVPANRARGLDIGLRLTGAALEVSPAVGAQGPGSAPPRALAVETAVPARMTFSDEIRATGTTRSRHAVEIRPDAGGRVTAITFTRGQQVAAGGNLIHMDDATERAALKAAEATLAEARTAMERQSRLRPGLPVMLASAAWPERSFAGTVTALDTRVDVATRSVAVRASVDNADRALTSGMFMDVTLGFAQREAQTVPERALVVEGAQSFVYLLAGGAARRVEVTTGQARDGFVEITGGLDAGALVITSDLHRLEDGADVEPRAVQASLEAGE